MRFVRAMLMLLAGIIEGFIPLAYRCNTYIRARRVPSSMSFFFLVFLSFGIPGGGGSL